MPLFEDITNSAHNFHTDTLDAQLADNMSDNYILADLIRQITFALEEGGCFVYWHHNVKSFNFLMAIDTDEYHHELKQLRKQFRDGRVTSVTAGDDHIVGDTTLHTMEVDFINQPCYPYMLLRERGLIDDTDHTPYFFTSARSRDNAIEYITKTRG